MNIEIKDTDSPSNIVAIRPSLRKDLEITLDTQEKASACYATHKHIEVCEKTRTVTCCDCGFVLDPFQYLLHWAKSNEQRMDALEGMKVQKRILTVELEDLNRKIKNARGVLKRAGQPQPYHEAREFHCMRINADNKRTLDKLAELEGA